MRFDAAGRTLILAAHIAEDRNPFHPLDAVAQAAKLRGRAWRSNYDKAANRLFDCNGLDLMDFSQEEAIDILVAAAFWEVA